MSNSVYEHFGILSCILALLFSACSGQTVQTRSRPRVPLSGTSEEFATLAMCVVCVNTGITYEIHRFANGRGSGDTMDTAERQTISGGGLIIGFDPSRSSHMVLTSKHLVAPPDTTYEYYRDESGAETARIYATYVVKEIKISSCLPTLHTSRTSIVALDSRYDIALILIETEERMGTVYPFEMGYRVTPSWGDWVYLYVFSGGIKQIAGGPVSESPYPGTFIVGATVRAGASGGPVFAVLPETKSVSFVGIVESVPFNAFEYIAPSHSFPKGYRLTPDDIQQSIVQRKMLVENGTTFVVGAQVIREFLGAHRAEIERAGVLLDAKYYSD